MKNKIVLALSGLIALVVLITSCQSEEELTFKRYYTAGAVLYQSHCQNCHAANGEGLGGLIPPLNDSVYLRSTKERIPCIIKNGLTGNITINGKLYTEKMPEQSQFTPIELAEVITYVTNSFGNKLGVTETQRVSTDLAGCK
jgi:mono/diheme cytochrome c family protein